MYKPRILLPFPASDNKCPIPIGYPDSLLLSGAHPVLMPIPDSVSDKELSGFDGLLLAGGGDVAPELYGEKREEKCGIPNTVRDNFELYATRYFYDNNIPVFAVCRGIQVLNVALGGTLFQHIENHSQTLSREKASHSIIISKDSPLYFKSIGEKADVNSFHHQALDRISEKLTVCAKSASDSIVEGVYSRSHIYCVGVQWHPEAMFGVSGYSKLLFSDFVAKCNEYHNRESRISRN